MVVLAVGAALQVSVSASEGVSLKASGATSGSI